jgi:polyisoprenoid-binding protein YceI
MLAFVILLAVIPSASAQMRYSIDKGEISFTSNAELELIRASTSAVQGLIDPATNQFAFTIEIKTFKGFNSELQREHFNEKYMESETYPKAKFSGKIIEQLDFSQNGVYEVRAKGDLEIHGQKQTRIIKGKITSKDSTLKIETHFVVPLTDHNIQVPTIVRQKIATEIMVDFVASMILK